MIYLEPRKSLDNAIIGEEDGVLIYSYTLLVEQYIEMDGDTNKDDAYRRAVDHIEYNILGTHMRGWPIIQEDLGAYYE